MADSGDQGRGRRYLLTCAITRYRLEPTWNRPELVADPRRVQDLLCGDFLPPDERYEHRDVLGDSPTSVELLDRLRDFCLHEDRRPTDYLAVYLAGHGEILDDGDHVLLTADSSESDLLHRTVHTSDIMKCVLGGTRVRRLLLLIDTCYSGRGGEDLVREALRRLDWPSSGPHEHASSRDGNGVVVVAATRPYQEATPGSFTTCLDAAARSLATAGNAPRSLRIGAIVSAVNNSPRRPESQNAVWHQVGMDADEPNFIPNPRYRQPLISVDLLEQERARHDEQRATQMRDRFKPASRWFTGRRKALVELVQWLADPARDPRPRVVTGNAGSGKTAVVGLLAMLSDPEQRPTVPLGGLPEELSSLQGAIRDSIYAGTLTTGQVRDRIAAAAGVRADSTQELITALNSEDEGPVVVLVDALDEAADQDELCRTLLSPLARRCGDSLHLLLGSRPHLLTDRLLGSPDSGRNVVVDLDDKNYADPASIRAYVKRILESEDTLDSYYQPSGIYREAPEDLVDAVTEAISEAAGESFLVARITATTETTAEVYPNPHDPEWYEGLPRRAGDAMRRDLELRLGTEARKAADLLMPLAYAQGNGLPWEDVWPRLADALSPGHGYGDDDLMWLRRAAGSYAVENVADGRSVYRLYHQALVEHLRRDRNQEDDQRVLAETLLGRVRAAPGGVRDWEAAHPYIRNHLATHAAAGRSINALLEDARFIMYTGRPALLAALDTTTSPRAGKIAGFYRRAAPRLRSKPAEEHPSYLQLAAHCSQLPDVAEKFDELRPPTSWSTRWAAWRTASPHYTFSGNTGPVRSLAVAESGGNAVVFSAGNTVRMWDLITGVSIGKPLMAANKVVLTESTGRPLLVSSSNDGFIRAWSPEIDDSERRVVVRAKKLRIADFAVGELFGRVVVAYAASDYTIRVADFEGQRPDLKLHGSAVPGTMVLVNAGDTSMLLAGTTRGEVHKWDLMNGKTDGFPLVSLEGSSVHTMVHSVVSGRSILICGLRDGSVHFYDALTGEQVFRPLHGHQAEVGALTLSEYDGRSIAVVGSDDGTIRLWDLETGEEFGEALTGHLNGVTALASTVIDGGPAIVSGSDDSTIRVWDLAPQASMGTAALGHTDRVNAVCVGRCAGETVVISGSSDSTIRTWNVATGDPVGQPIAVGERPVRCLAPVDLASGTLVLSGSDDGAVGLWDLGEGRAVWRSETYSPFPRDARGAEVRALGTVDLNGKSVVAAGSRHLLDIRDLDNGKLVRWVEVSDALWRSATFVGHRGRPTIFFSSGPTSDAVVYRGFGRFSRQHRIARHPSAVTAIAATLVDGELMVASASERLILIDSMTSRHRRTVERDGHSQVAAVAWLDRDHLVVASGRTVTVFRVDPVTRSVFEIELDANVAAVGTEGHTIVAATTLGLVALETPLRP